MKLHIMSDLHINHLAHDVPITDADVIIIAGDTHGKSKTSFKYAKNIASKFQDKTVIFIMGNHEYYSTDIKQEMKKNLVYFKNECKDVPNLVYLQDTWIVIDDVAFFGSTYWSEFDLFDRKTNCESMNISAKNFSDFEWINNGFSNAHYDDPMLGLMPMAKKFTPRDAQLMHRESKNLIKHFIKEHEGMKRVVITHHAPSPKSIHPKYENDIFNSCFASNDEDILGTGIDLWIHGHMHSNFDYFVEDTRVICNPRGYSKYHENIYGFIDDLVVEI